jgi:serine/threonine protein kinase
MKLKLNIENDENLSFIDSMPDDVRIIANNIIKKNKEKCPKLKSSDSGAFGTIEITTGKVKKLLSLIPKKHHKKLINDHKIKGKKSQLYFLINRLDNYCDEIKSFVSISRKYFPNNFVKIFKCNYCQQEKEDDLPYLYVEMGLGNGFNLKDAINKKLLSQNQLNTIYDQIHYIASTLNFKKLFHNDMKPANIIIVKNNKVITYDSLKNRAGEQIILKISANNFIPVIIDYDLSSKGSSNTVAIDDFLSPGSPDISFFKATTEKLSKKQAKYLKKIPEYNDINDISKNLKEIYNSMKQNKNISVKYIK